MTEAPLCAQPRAEEVRGGLMAASDPHREQRGSAELCDSDRARGNGMELCQGRGSWGSWPKCWSSRSVWTEHSDTGFGFWVVQQLMLKVQHSHFMIKKSQILKFFPHLKQTAADRN